MTKTPRKTATKTSAAAPKKTAPKKAIVKKAAPAKAPPTFTPTTAPGFDNDSMRQLETLSVNIAKAAMTAQSALAKTIFKQTDTDTGGSSDPFQVGPAMTEIMSALAAKPDKLIEAQTELLTGYMELWGTMTRRSFGVGQAQAAESGKPADKRFSDPKWQENQMFDMMKSSYLLSSNWINKLISSVEGVDPMVKRRAEFFTKLLTDAMSPSNFLMSNPAALQALIESNGETLVKGMERFADDMARGDGKLMISQADTSRFKVGKNVATTPGKVVYRGKYFELLQYSPTTDQVREIPLLIFPPWINKFYILDLQEKNSLIKWLVGQGFT
ncbi:MAG: class I poly(R)-hydroxyalkanoic acid synthase, partial [Asticcacaulis sp.]